MKSLLSRLTNLGIVANVLQSPSSYIFLGGGFAADRENLRNDAQRVNSSFNRNIREYGNKKYST